MFANEANVCFVEVSQSHSTRAGRAAHRERNIDVPVPGACPRLNRRTDRRCACATVDSERDRRSDEVVPVPHVVEEIAEVVQTIPRSATRRVSPTESSMCQVVKQRRALPTQTAQKTLEVPQIRRRRDEPQFSDRAVDSSSATENRCHTVLQLQFIQHPCRGAETNPSPENSEGDRDSTGSVPDKMVDVTVVPVHRCTSWKGRPKSHSCSFYSETMRFSSREIGEHTCPPGLKHLLEKVEMNTAMLKTMLLHSEE